MEDGEQWEDRMDEEEEERPKNFLATARYTLREPLVSAPALSETRHRLFILTLPMPRPQAEFLGMLVLVTLGIGADCQVKISQNQAGGYSNMNVVWGMATMIGICRSCPQLSSPNSPSLLEFSRGGLGSARRTDHHRLTAYVSPAQTSLVDDLEGISILLSRSHWRS